MNGFLKEVARETTQRAAAVAGFIAEAPATLTDRVMVVLPSFDSHLQVGPLRWQPRPTGLPVRGDECLVMFDNTDEPWVVMYWPS